MASYVFVSFLVIGLYTFLVYKGPERVIRNNYFPSGIRVLRDDEDRTVYYERSAWYREGKIAYKEVFEEYPQLAVYYFALPAIFAHNLSGYLIVHSVFMAIAYVAFFYVFLKLLQHFNRPFWLSLFFFLPSFLFFTLNRYDILPVLLSSISLLFFFRKRYVPAFFFIALAIMTKWYPLLFVPVYFFAMGSSKVIKAYAISAFAAPIMIFIGITVWQAGWSATLWPYIWHLGRGDNWFSFLYLVNLIFREFNIAESSTTLIFLIFQFSAFIIPGVIIYRSKAQPIPKGASIALITLSVMVFVFFAKFYSAQWVMWIYPLLLLHAKNRKILAILVLFDLFNYLQYPIGIELIPHFLPLFLLISAIKAVLYIWLAYETIAPSSINKKIAELNGHFSSANI